MTGPHTVTPDPSALLARLDAELGDVTHAVERIRRDMGALRPAPRWVPPPAPTPLPPPPPPPRAAPPPRRSREGLGARLLAATGAAVTLLGVVLLLVLAARSGWFGPGARVIAGGLLGLGLAATGLHIRARYATGAVALVATGVASLYLDLAAASVLYDFVPGPATLVLGLGVLAGGLVVADRWDTPHLAVGAVAGLVVLVPVVARTAPGTVIVLLAVVQVPAAFLAWRRGWSAPVLTATAGAALVALVQGAWFAGGRPDSVLVGDAVGAVTLLVVALVLSAASRETLAVRTRIAVAVIALPPVLAACALLGRWPGVAVAGVVAVLLVVVGERLRRVERQPALPTVLAAMGAVAGFQATAMALEGSSSAMVLLGQTTVLAVVASVTGRRGPLVAGVLYGFVGLGVALGTTVPISAVTAFPSPLRLPAAATAALLTAAAATVLLAVLRTVAFGDRTTRRVVCGGLGAVALYGAASMVVALALLVSPTRVAFLSGHVLVTVSWAVLALILLVRGLRDSAPRVLGAVLVVAAVAKLVLFDLVALDGIARVAAFLCAGLVLLVAGARYASLVSREGADAEVRSGAGCG